MNNSTQKQAVIYCRISDPKQAVRGDGLRSQETRCREYARHRNYGVIEVFQDNITGKHAQRPGMKAMLTCLRKNRSKKLVVIIDDISRMARQVTSHWELRALVAEAGGILESPSLKFGDTSDDHFLENILASAAQHQREKNAEQTKNRMKARVQNGYWVFQAPTGYRFEKIPGHGKMLVRNEPVASIVQEALEGYASGRFETQADVMRFLQANPLFPKDRSGIIRNERVSVLLKQCAYAGYIESQKWDVALRPGQHEGLVSYRTFQRVQERMKSVGRTPKRPNLKVDFPLRGFVLCGDCGRPLTSCWSKGSNKHYPYYHCQKRGCVRYGKSILREKIEGEFETLLQSLQPSPELFRCARSMFRKLWDRQFAQAEAHCKALMAQLEKTEKQVGQILERILEASVPSVIAAYENRIRKLEEEKLLTKDRIAETARPASSFDVTLRTALHFLANPWNIWNSGKLEERQAVLKLAFAERLQYTPENGFRTANLSLPFKVLGDFSGRKNQMVHPTRFEPVAFAFGARKS
jgi:DNA invertase Pin-like site-specific DNA recombinase